MKIDIIYGNDVFVIPKSEVMTKIVSAEASDLRLLLLIASDELLRKDFNAEIAAKTLGCAKSDIESSLKFWIGAGIFKSSDEKSSAPAQKTTNPKLLPDNDRPKYTGKEIGEILNKNKNLQWLLNECQNIIGKIFTPTEFNQIIGLVEYLRFEYDYVTMLVAFCKKFKDPLTTRYVEQTGYNLHDKGIDTTGKLDLYIKAHEEIEPTKSKLRRLFGFGDRELSAKEEKLFQRWCLDWMFSYDILNRAYELTIDSTHKLSLPYMNTILENWYKSGLKTLEEIDAAAIVYQQDKEKSLQSGGSFDTDEFFELAVKRTYENMEKKKGG